MSLIAQVPVGTRVEFQELSRRTIAQNKKLWPLLTEISQQVVWYGETLTPEEWKDVFTASLKKQTRIVPGIDEKSFVVLGLRTSKLSKDKFSDLLELIPAFGAQHGVTFHDGLGPGRARQHGERRHRPDGVGMSHISNEDKLRELRRELQFRIDVYDRWIAQGQISVGEAQLRKDIMRAIVADYEAAA